MNRMKVLVALAPVLLLAACASGPDTPPVPDYDPAAAVAAVRAAGAAAEGELVVNPLGDSDVQDLRQQAERHIAAGQYGQAAAVLDQALALSAKNPELLQLRAEVALWQHQPAQAEQFARRAIAIGTQVGPLCRRHWETVTQARTILAAAGDASMAAPAVAEARRQRDACTVAQPPRY